VTRTITFVVLLAGLLLGASGGQYMGTWTSDGGVNSGKVNISVDGSGGGQLSFTFQGQMVKPNKVTAKVDGEKVEFLCELDLDGFKLKTAFNGMVEGKSMSGKYQSTNAEDGSVLDSGTWKVTQQ
jgi:hypothetical protein